MQPQPNRTESNAPEIASACFATHGSFGVVDLGATKTVIGSQKIGELLASLDPQVRRMVSRCPCDITFRFGNHGVLQSRQALVVPIHGLLLKIAVVPGSTPFLLSNTLLRMLGAVIDTERKVLHATKINRDIPLILTSKGLFLLDLNELAHQPNGQPVTPGTADTETFMCVKQDTPIFQESKTSTEMSNRGEKSVLKQTETCMSRSATETPPGMPQEAKQAQCESNECHQQVSNHGHTEPSSRSKCPVSGSTVDCVDRHGSVQALATDAAGARAHQDGFYPSVDERTGSQQAGFRTKALGQNLCPGLERGPTLGNMGSAALREVPQASPSEIHVLCDRKGGASRTDGGKDTSESSGETTKDPPRTLMMPKAKARPHVQQEHPEMPATHSWEEDIGICDGTRFEMVSEGTMPPYQPPQEEPVQTALEMRVINMENALARVMDFLEQQHAAREDPSLN